MSKKIEHIIDTDSEVGPSSNIFEDILSLHRDSLRARFITKDPRIEALETEILYLNSKNRFLKHLLLIEKRKVK